MCSVLDLPSKSDGKERSYLNDMVALASFFDISVALISK